MVTGSLLKRAIEKTDDCRHNLLAVGDTAEVSPVFDFQKTGTRNLRSTKLSELEGYYRVIDGVDDQGEYVDPIKRIRRHLGRLMPVILDSDPAQGGQQAGGC